MSLTATHRAHAAFLDAIRAAPADDAPRLIYADWLEEQGDPRGEFIRLQCELAGLPTWDRRAALLRWRERQLLDQYDHIWRSELPIIDGVHWGRFERGFVAGATVRSTGLLYRHANALAAATPCDMVTLMPHHGESFSAMPALPWLRTLAVGHDDDYAFEPMQMEQFANSPLLGTLTTLKFKRCNLENAGVDVLARSPVLAEAGQLQALILQENYLGAAGVGSLARASWTSTLKRLVLGGVGFGNYAEDPTLGSDGVETLAGSSQFANLVELDLSGNEIDDQAIRHLANSRYLHRLERLDLHLNNLRGATLALLGEGGFQLKSLNLGQNTLSHGGLSELVRVESWPGLAELAQLRASTCELGSADAAALARSGLPTRLHVLHLGQNRLGPEGVAALGRVSWPQLHDLDLSDNDLRGAGGRQLAATGLPGQLVRLSLKKNNLDGAAVGELVESLGRGQDAGTTGLRELDLTENVLNDQAVAALADGHGMETVQELRLCGCQLEADRLRRLCAGTALTSLAHLFLDRNDFGVEGVLEVLNSPLAPRLVSLGIQRAAGWRSEPKLSPSVWERLARAVGLQGQAVGPEAANQNDAAEMLLQLLTQTDRLPQLANLSLGYVMSRNKALWRTFMSAPGLARLRRLDTHFWANDEALHAQLWQRFEPWHTDGASEE